MGAVAPAVPWPQFDANENTIIIDTPISAVSKLISQPCQLWDTIGFNFK
jgi:hypothetical protein